MKYVYIGQMPPPYGGVTIKNRILYGALKKDIFVDYIDFGFNLRKVLKNVLKLLLAIADRDTVLILGLSSNSLSLFNEVYYHLNKSCMKKSIVIIMGGTAANFFCENMKKIKLIKEYKAIFVETCGMRETFFENGINNVQILPNCREKSIDMIKTKKNNNKELKCVFFSLISKEKGADIVIEAANKLLLADKSISIDFYGEINLKYKEEFIKKINDVKSIKYKGIFKGNNENVYKKLNEYDLLLLPTRWVHEGVPGILIEAKIAGVPAIVSNINFNSEIIEDGKNGIILKQNTTDELFASIKKMDSNRKLLDEMKKNARISAEFYYIENHIKKITDMLI